MMSDEQVQRCIGDAADDVQRYRAGVAAEVQRCRGVEVWRGRGYDDCTEQEVHRLVQERCQGV
jgi:hypothetical protein